MIHRTDRKYPQPDKILIAALAAAGLRAATKRQDAAAFLVVFLVRTHRQVEGGLLETSVLEIESWGPRPTVAWEQLSKARSAAQELPGVYGIRSVVEANGPTDLPTGEAGWERYRMQLEITHPTR